MLTIKRRFKENEEKFKRVDNHIVYDGIVNEDEFTKSGLKVLWILKEVNSPDDTDWNMRDTLANLKNENGKGLKHGWASTFTPIVYTTYGIFNNLDWDHIDYLCKDPSIIDVLNKVAYINVKKVPGNSSANFKEIKDYYKKNKEAIHEQVEIINPEVIIFGNTFEFFEEDFFDMFGQLNKDTSSDSLYKYYNEKYLLLWAYHPNNRMLTQKEYCNFIINSVNEWKIKYKGF